MCSQGDTTIMKTYTILGRTVTLDDAVYNFSYYQLRYRQLSEDAVYRFNTVFFNVAANIDQLLANKDFIIREAVKDMIEDSVSTLNEKKIYDISTDEFLRMLYSNDVFYTWDNLIVRIADSNTNINQALEARRNDLEYLKDNRDRISWTGYGLSGAIQAAAVAGAMNAFSGMAYSLSNAIKFSQFSNQAASLKAENLKIFYRNAPEIIADIAQGTRDVVINLLTKRAGMKFYIPGQKDYDAACGYLETLKRGVIAAEDIPKCACDLVERFPYNPVTYEYLVTQFGDEQNEIQRLTKDLYYGDYLLSYKHECIRTFIDENRGGMTTFDGAVNIRDICRKKCLAYGIESAEYDAAFENILSEIDRCSHYCDGILYENTDELINARKEQNEFRSIIASLNTNDERSILDARSRIEKFASKSKDKYLNYMSAIMNDFDTRYRSVEGVTYDTRETADSVKSELALIANLKSTTSLSSGEKINSALERINSNDWTTPKIDLLREYFERAAEVLKYQNDVIDDHSFDFPDRLYETDKLYELLLLRFESNLFGSMKDEFNTVINDFTSRLITVGNTRYSNILEANKQYFKMLSHAHSYENNWINKSTEKKNIFSKLIDKTKETVTKGYAGDYNLFSNNGAEALPAEIPDGKSIAVKKDKTFNSDKENLMKNFNRFSLLDRTWSITDGVAYNAEQVIIPDVKISEQYINDTFRKEDNKD